jgi:multisubunit Na+/H+ antiporter MnhB subunit
VSWSLAVDIAMLGLLLAIGVFTIAVRDTFAAVIAFAAYGLLVAVVWVRLQAVDVALTEAAIGSGLTGLLMLGAAARLRGTERTVQATRPSLGLRAFAAVLSTAVAAALGTAVWFFVEPAPSLAPAAMAELGSTGLGNPVTAVLMAYRATDTLLEKVVLVLAVIGVWSLAPDRAWGGRPGTLYRPDPDGVLPFFARVLPPFGVIVGVYLLWVSADEPGSAFAAGTVLAAMWVLVMMAGLADAPPVGSRRLRLAVLAGPVVFVAVGLAGMLIADAFLAYPVAFAKPLIIAIEIAMVLSIAAMLGMLIAGTPQRSTDS